MSGRRGSRSHGARLGVVLLVAVLMGCGPQESLIHGVRLSADATGFELASLMPTCGCATFINRETSGQPIELVTWWHETEVGSHILKPEDGTRVGFDWAGPANSDVYTIEAYRLEPNPQGGFTRSARRLSPIEDFISNAGHLDTDCKKMDCPFGTLAMDRVLHASTAGGQPVTRQSGVSFTAGGQQIAASSSLNTCGCMLLSNISRERQSVTLRSSFHSKNDGVMAIPWDTTSDRQPVYMIGFDWSGTEQEDRYLISAIGAENGTPATKETTRTLRIQDYIRITGQMDQLECAADGALLRLPLPATNGASPATSQFTVTCPFGALAMREASLAAAPPAAATPAPPAKGMQP